MRVERSKSGDLQAFLHPHRFGGVASLKHEIMSTLGLNSLEGEESFCLLWNGRILTDDQVPLLPTSAVVTIVPRVLGGKGGFGSMLRAIGAQIEKTTNRDACRDLSGRRLRDINEEQRLKKWFSKQEEREHEKKEARKRKLDKLRQVADGPPLPKIEDQQYLQQREDMVDAVFEAVDKGFEVSKDAGKVEAAGVAPGSSDSEEALEASSSSSLVKTVVPDESSSASYSSPALSKGKKTTMKKTFLDEGLDSCSSDEDSADEVAAKKAKVQ